MKISELAGDAWPKEIDDKFPSGHVDIQRSEINDMRDECNLDEWIDEDALFTILCIAKYKPNMKSATKYVSENMHKFVRVGRSGNE